jgi:hypothetical protein
MGENRQGAMLEEVLEQDESRFLPYPSTRFMSLGDDAVHSDRLPNLGLRPRGSFQQDLKLATMQNRDLPPQLLFSAER